jgi:hypothetical protein
MLYPKWYFLYLPRKNLKPKTMSLIHKKEDIAAGTPSPGIIGTRASPWQALLRSPYVLLLTIYIVSRIAYYLLGVRFDARGLPTYLQFIDTELLQHNLLQSLFYLHWQPPGYNLFLGIVLKLFPHASTAAFHVIHLAFGAAIICSLYYLMRTLSVRSSIALVTTAVFMVSPGIVLFENFIMWEYQLTFFLVLSAVFLFRFFKHRGFGYAIGFLLCQFWLVMSRNQYHLVYFFLTFVLFVYFTKYNRRAVALAGSILLALILALFLKNLVLFGKFASSTWLEMGMGPLLLHQMTHEERVSLVARGKLSPLATNAFPDQFDYGIPLSALRPFITAPEKTSIPVLDQEFKSSGNVNYNNVGYLEAQKLYTNDLKSILRYCPKAYLRSVAIAWYAYFLPAGDFPFFDLNLPRIHKVERFSDIVLCGQFKYSENRKDLRLMYGRGNKVSVVLHTGVFLLIGLPALFIFGVWFVFRGVRRHTLSLPQALLLGFILFNIFYTTATANFLSSYENNRYRFPVDGFFIILLALALEQIFQKIKTLRAAPRL